MATETLGERILDAACGYAYAVHPDIDRVTDQLEELRALCARADAAARGSAARDARGLYIFAQDASGVATSQRVSAARASGGGG